MRTNPGAGGGFTQTQGDALWQRSVDTIAALKALAFPSSTQRVVVDGYYAPNDGGGGRFVSRPATSISIASSSSTITATAHGFRAGQAVVFSGLSDTSRGLTNATTYYVCLSPGTNSFSVASTFDLATASAGATPIAISAGATVTGVVNPVDDGGEWLASTSSPNAGVWVRIIQDKVNMKEWGVKFDGSSFDNAPAIRASVAACLDYRYTAFRKLVSPGGIAKFNSTIKIIANGLVWEGAGKDALGISGTVMGWNGPAATQGVNGTAGNASIAPAFEMYLRNCDFRNLVIRPYTECYTGTKLVNYATLSRPASVTWVPTHSTWRNLAWTTPVGGAGPYFTHCLEVNGTDTDLQDNNNDLHTFYDCDLEKYTYSAVHTIGCLQSHKNTFVNCGRNGAASSGKYGIMQENSSGHNGGYFLDFWSTGGYNTVADFLLAGPHSHVLIEGWNSEHSNRALQTVGQGSSQQWPVVIRNSRFELDLPVDGECIQMGHTGPLTLEDSQISSLTSGVAPKIKLYTGASIPSSMRHKGNLYQTVAGTDMTVSPITIQSGNWRIEDDGNLWMHSSDSQTQALPRHANALLLQDPITQAFRPSAAIAETFSRRYIGSLSQSALASGSLHLSAIYLFAGQVVSTITFRTGATAAATPTAQWFALYSPALAKLGVTSDDTTAAWAAHTPKTLTLASAYTVPTSGLYYVGVMVAAATVPSMVGNASSTGVAGLSPQISAIGGTALTTPSTAPATAASSFSQFLLWAYVS